MTRGLLVLGLLAAPAVHAADKPNVVLIITDDQGIGDLSLHGNPILKTPHLDKIAETGVRFSRFYVAPVCAPTRASLLTGRYNYRTGVVDTFVGRALMHPDEVTIAEALAKAGYKTGQFGKWHLGDNYPLRPQDQGFAESLMLRGGGLGQPSDPPGGSSYFDPHLEHNGKPVQPKGYVTDVVTDAALDFIDKAGKEPFFVYLAYNAPHGPLEVPADYHAMYKGKDLGPDSFPKGGYPWKLDQPDGMAKLYGMVKNIDDNVGRLLARLEQRQLRDNTIVVFLTDNGPQQERYRMGLRGLKASVFEGGVRVPFFVSWPGGLKAGRVVDKPAAHIDVLPTLLELCGAERGPGRPLDGRSLAPLLKEGEPKWDDRTLYVQWHRGEVPDLGRAFAAIGPRWKLVQPAGVQPNATWKDAPLQLFDLLADPYEQKDVARDNAAVVAEMKKGYDAWFASVKAEREFQPPKIVIGTEKEPVTTLTRQDWRGPNAAWTPTSNGHWEAEVARAGKYRVRLWFAPVKGPSTVTFRFGDRAVSRDVAAEAKELTLSGVELPAGPGRVLVEVKTGDAVAGPSHVALSRE